MSNRIQKIADLRMYPHSLLAEMCADRDAGIERLNARLKVLQDACHLDDKGDGFLMWTPAVKKALHGEEVDK